MLWFNNKQRYEFNGCHIDFYCLKWELKKSKSKFLDRFLVNAYCAYILKGISIEISCAFFTPVLIVE